MRKNSAVGDSGTTNQSGLFPGRVLAQVFLFGGVNADDVAVGDEQRNHDLEASFEPYLLP